MAVFTIEWCRIEGSVIPDLGKQYGTFSHLPATTKVLYGAPEIQINNPTNIINGCVYKVVPISEFGYTSIPSIDESYGILLNKISEYDKTVNLMDDTNSAQYYYEPFTVEESCVIFHADSTKESFDRYAIIYIDEYATPEIVTIGASYKGPAIPVGETFSLDDIELYAVYSDGNRAIIKDGYITDPADRIITQLNSNVVKITYESPTGTTFITSIIIQGVKNLQSIEVLYDGPSVAFGNEALRKYFVVIAHYSDGSSGTVTSFTFPDGNIVSETNAGVIAIYYKGFYATVVVPTYDVSSSRLIAYYNGPNVEIEHDFNINYCNIKIYYKSNDEVNTYYEDVDPALCIFAPMTIEHEGVNYIEVQYTGKLGPVNTKMVVIGIKPKVVLNFIEAEDTGPEIVQGKSFSPERVICKAHYSDGSVVVVKNFSINSNVIEFVGLNEYEVTYKEDGTIVTTTIGVIGLEKDSTTETNYTPIYLQNNYPEATRLNNRYRGPAEAYKHNDTDMMIFENIKTLYELFAYIEQDFNRLAETIGNSNSVKVRTLNNVSYIENQTTTWLQDRRFTTGKYQLETEENNE